MGVKYGFIVGFLTVLIYLAAYMINLDWFLSQWIYWLTMLLYVGAMYRLANKEAARGVTTFKELVRPLFICFLLANAIYYLFYYIMITFVNPEIYTMQVARMTALKALDLEESDTKFQLYAYILSYFQAAIGGFVIAGGIAYSKKQS